MYYSIFYSAYTINLVTYKYFYRTIYIVYWHKFTNV